MNTEHCNNPSEKRNVFNLIILDESGSMYDIKKASLSGLNETLQSIQHAQQEHPNQVHYVSFVTFNSKGIKTVFENVSTQQIRLLTERDYNPDGGTPLFDAMGMSLSRLESQIGDNTRSQVLVTIITDGYENASREYSNLMINNLVQRLKTAKDWMFTYLGANQNVEEVARGMSIDSSFSYTSNSVGTQAMWEKERRSRAKFYHDIEREEFYQDKEWKKKFFDEEGDMHNY